MGNRSCRRFRKFYEDQVKQILGLLDKHFKPGQIDLDIYFEICEQKGIDPDPEEMPPTMEDYPSEVQVAFLLHELLPDRWEGTAGFYMGKEMSSLGTLLDVYEVKDKKTVIYFLKHIESRFSKQINEDLERKRKAQERRGKAGTKPGISVQG